MAFEVKGVRWECSGRVRGHRTRSVRCTRLEARAREEMRDWRMDGMGGRGRTPSQVGLTSRST